MAKTRYACGPDKAVKAGGMCNPVIPFNKPATAAIELMDNVKIKFRTNPMDINLQTYIVQCPIFKKWNARGVSSVEGSVAQDCCGTRRSTTWRNLFYKVKRSEYLTFQ